MVKISGFWGSAPAKIFIFFLLHPPRRDLSFKPILSKIGPGVKKLWAKNPGFGS
jgi:hypothetical protein